MSDLAATDRFIISSTNEALDAYPIDEETDHNPAFTYYFFEALENDNGDLGAFNAAYYDVVTTLGLDQEPEYYDGIDYTWFYDW